MKKKANEAIEQVAVDMTPAEENDAITTPEEKISAPRHLTERGKTMRTVNNLLKPLRFALTHFLVNNVTEETTNFADALIRETCKKVVDKETEQRMMTEVRSMSKEALDQLRSILNNI